MTRDDVELIDRATVYQGYFRLDRYRLRFALFEGGQSAEVVREVFQRGHVASVVPVDPDRDKVVLIEQFRVGPYAAGWDPWLIEVVAGVIEPGETASDVVVREAREEAGCEIVDLVPIARYLSSPGACSETSELYCGRVDSRGVGGVHGLDEEGEDIRVMVVSIEEALALLADGRIVNAKSIIALQWLALHYPELKRRWLGAKA